MNEELYKWEYELLICNKRDECDSIDCACLLPHVETHWCAEEHACGGICVEIDYKPTDKKYNKNSMRFALILGVVFGFLLKWSMRWL